MGQGGGGHRLARGHGTLFDGISLDQVSTSMTINPRRRCSSHVPARGRGARRRRRRLAGTIQNDVLKEYIARGTYIFPPVASLQIRHRHLRVLPIGAAPVEHHLDLRLPHRRGRSTPVQELAFTLPTPSSTSGPPSPPGWPSTISLRGCRSSSWLGSPCSKRSPSSGQLAGCGLGS